MLLINPDLWIEHTKEAVLQHRKTVKSIQVCRNLLTLSQTAQLSTKPEILRIERWRWNKERAGRREEELIYQE